MKKDDARFGRVFFAVVRKTMAHRIAVSVFVLLMLWTGIGKFLKLAAADPSTPVFRSVGWFVNGLAICSVSCVVLWIIWKPDSSFDAKHGAGHRP